MWRVAKVRPRPPLGGEKDGRATTYVASAPGRRAPLAGWHWQPTVAMGASNLLLEAGAHAHDDQLLAHRSFEIDAAEQAGASQSGGGVSARDCSKADHLAQNDAT